MKKTRKFIAIAISVIFLETLFIFTGCSPKAALEYGTLENISLDGYQYLPEVNTILGNETGTAQLSETVSAANTTSLLSASAQSSVVSNDIEYFMFENYIHNLAQIDSTGGAGKYLGYEVDEVESEMYNIVNRAPYSKQWFRVEREDDGTDYYSDWAFLIEPNEKNGDLTVTRVSWKTRCSYYDRESEAEVEDLSDGTSCIQYNVMRIRYYTEDGSEVVEISMYNVMEKQNVFYSTEYNYLKNIKDKSILKYDIIACPRTEKGIIIDGNTPYGYIQDYSYLEYDGKDNYNWVQLYNQNYYGIDGIKNLDTFEGLGFSYIGKHDGSVIEYSSRYDSYENYRDVSADAVQNGDTEENLNTATKNAVTEMSEMLGVYDSDTTAAMYADGDIVSALTGMIGSVSQKAVENFDLALKWEDIYDASSDCEYEYLSDPVDLPYKIKAGNNDISFFVNSCTVYANAYLTPNEKLRDISEMNLALKVTLLKDDGTLVYLETENTSNDFKAGTDIMWYGAWLYIDNYDFSVRSLTSLQTEGTYIFGYTLTDGENNYGNFSKFDTGNDDTSTVYARFSGDGYSYKIYNYKGFALLSVTK